MAWRLAGSLIQLRNEFNTFAPYRYKGSDGTIGDPAHADRASRHNPNNAGVVCALDITHDPDGGCDVHHWARYLAAHPNNPCFEYVISNGQTASRSRGWAWSTYTGSNQHNIHAHFAVGRGPDSEPTPPYDDATPWGVSRQQEVDVNDVQNSMLTQLFNWSGDVGVSLYKLEQSVKAIEVRLETLLAKPVLDVDEVALAAELGPVLRPGITTAEVVEAVKKATREGTA